MHNETRYGPVSKSLDGVRILLVEDDAFIALDCQEALLEAGASIVEVAKTKATVLDLLNQSGFDAAIIDINLGVESGIPIAEAVSARNVPLIFCTGTSGNIQLSPTLSSVPFIAKPYSMAELIGLIGSIVAIKPQQG